MDGTEEIVTDGRPADAQATRPDRSRTRRLVAVAAGTTIALGAGGIAYAATADPSPTPTESTPSETTPDEVEGDGARPHGPFGGGGFGALHGEFVVETEEGVYETVTTQRGTIDEITEDSLTVTSEDGYTKTYALDSAELDTGDRGPMTDPTDLAAGDEVMVMANVEDSTATVTRVIDLANLPERPMPGGPGWHSHGDGPPAPGTQTAPDTAAS